MLQCNKIKLKKEAIVVELNLIGIGTVPTNQGHQMGCVPLLVKNKSQLNNKYNNK